MCPVNSQNQEKLAQFAVSPAHGRGGSQDEVKLTTTVRLYARSLAHVRVARSTRRKFYYSLRLLLVPTTYLGQRDYHIVWNIYVLCTPSIYLYKATIKNTFCIYTRPQIVIETTVTTPSFPVYGSISKSLQPRQTVSGRINFVVCTSNQYAHFSPFRGINQNECMNDH